MFLPSICGRVWGIWCWGASLLPPGPHEQVTTSSQHSSAALVTLIESFSCNYSVPMISSPGFDCKQLPACQLRQGVPKWIECTKHNIACICLEWSYLSYLSDIHAHVGVILSSVLRNADGKSPFLLVLDARTFKEVARVEFEGIDIQKDIHGIFAPFSSPHTH